MSTLRLTADSSQLVSEVNKAKNALKTAKSEYKAASAEAENYGTKEGQLVNKIKAANQIQNTRISALKNYEKAIKQLETEIDKWEKEENDLVIKLKEAQQANDTTKIKEYEAALAKVRTQIKNNTTELTSMKKGYFDLRADIAETEKKLKDFNDELNDVSNTFEEVETVTDDAGDDMEDLGEGTEGAATAVFSLQDALASASTMLKNFGDIIDGITNKFEELVVNGIQKTADALVDLGKFSIEKGMSFEESMSGLMATMGIDKSSEYYEPLKETAEYYGRTTKYTATEAANALNILAQAGLSAEQQMAGIGTVLNLASAGAMDLNTAATYVTASVKGFGDEMGNAAYYADLIAKGASLANTDANLLGAALSGSAANAKAYSQSADSLTLSLLKLAEQNVKGTDASTALNRVMMDLYTPTSTAAKALDELGISAYDSNHKAKDLNIVIDELNTALQGYDEESQNMLKNTIFSTYGLNAFNKMTVTSKEKVDEFKESLAGAGGAAETMAKTMIDNLQGDLYAVQSAAEGFGIKIYEGIAPGLRQAVQAITTYISQLTDNFQNNGLGAAIEKISTAFSNFSAKIPSMLQKHTPTLIRVFNSIMNIIAIVIDSLPALIDSALPNLLKIIESLSSKLPSFLEKVMPLIIDGIGFLASNFPILIAGLYGLQGAAGAGSGLLSIGGIVSGIAMAAKVAGVSLSSVLPYVAAVIAVLAKIAAVITTIVAIVGTAYATSERFRNYFGSMLSDIKNRIKDTLGFMGEAVIRIMNASGIEVESSGEALDAILEMVRGVATAIVFIAGQAVNLICTGIELVVNAFTSSYEIFGSLINAIMALLNGNFEEAWGYVKEFGKNVGRGFSDMWGIVRDGCADFAGDFGDFLNELQNVAVKNPVTVSIESEIDVDSFKNDIRLISTWGLPGWDESKFGPLFQDAYSKNNTANRQQNKNLAIIQNGISAAEGAIKNWNSSNATFNNNYITNQGDSYTWNTAEAGDENVFLKMSRETEAYTKYTVV